MTLTVQKQSQLQHIHELR